MVAPFTDPTPYDDLDVHCSRKSNFLIDGQPAQSTPTTVMPTSRIFDSICNTYGTSGYPQCAAGTELICYSFTTGKYTAHKLSSGLRERRERFTKSLVIALQGTNNAESGRLGHYNAKTGNLGDWRV